MIPKPLNEIEWADIEALRDSGREEDDTIEFKASFSGGNDFLEFTESQRIKAVDSVAKEVIAFLNGRGGDIVIGVKESDNEHPKIEAIMPIAKVDAAADRLAMALAALIEPTQSVVGVRAIRQTDDATEGVIIVRAPSSLRAPHRNSREGGKKECFIRRGRQSVAMPMDEVQDLTLNREARRSDRFALLEEASSVLESGRLGVHQLPESRNHFRMVYVPLALGASPVDSDLLNRFSMRTPNVFPGDQQEAINVPFRAWTGQWEPTVRGKRSFDLSKLNNTFTLLGKEIYENGIMVTDFVVNGAREIQNQEIMGVYLIWIVGFIANSLNSMRQVLDRRPQFDGGFLQISALHSPGNHLIFGDSFFQRSKLIVEGATRFPFFETLGKGSFDEIFRQMQIDVCALAGVECEKPYSFLDG